MKTTRLVVVVIWRRRRRCSVLYHLTKAGWKEWVLVSATSSPPAPVLACRRRLRTR